MGWFHLLFVVVCAAQHDHLECDVPKMCARRRAVLAAPRPSDGFCSGELTGPGSVQRGKKNTGGVKMLIMMQNGRVGSTWLKDLLNSHSRVHCTGEELGDVRLNQTRSETWRKYAEFYGSPVAPDAALCAEQKSQVVLAGGKEGIMRQLVAQFDMRVVCLARSNPVENWLADVNGKAHQEACSGHRLTQPGETCYTNADARTVFRDAFWTSAGAGAGGTVTTLTHRAKCNIQGNVASSIEFYDECSKLHQRDAAKVFWLEYADLSCHTDAVLAALLRFLEVEPEPLGGRTNIKLTSDIDTLIPHFDQLALELAQDDYVAPGALKDALLSADNCHYLKEQPQTAAFCPRWQLGSVAPRNGSDGPGPGESTGENAHGC